MRRLLLFLAVTVLCLPLFAQSDLFISEYIEGSSNNKAIEIFNGTSSTVDLAAGAYKIEMYLNGSSSAGVTISLTGTVAAGDVYVLAHSSAAGAILAVADQTDSSGWFTGDDAVVLRKGGTVLDVVGQIGFDPGSEWGCCATSTQDHTLRRQLSVTAGDTNGSDAFDPSIEWDGFALDTFDGLGAHGASSPPPPTNRWTTTCHPGGTVWDITVHPNTTTTIFAGTEGGLYKSVDSGVNWTEVASAPSGTNVNAVKFAPSNPSILYLATSTSGVWKSSDGGTTWTEQSNGITTGEVITALGVHPTNPSIVYAGCRSSIYVTTDGGANWSEKSTAIGVIPYAIAVDPRTPANVYAATASDGSSDGVYRSADGGLTWSAANSGLTSDGLSYLVYDVVIDGSTNPSTIYIASELSGVAKSTTGTSWTQIHSNLNGTGSFAAAYSISFAPSSPSTLYAGGETGMYKSTNGGSSWTSIATPANTGSFFSELEIDPSSASTLYAASNTDLLRSTNGGSSWTATTTLPAFFIEALTVHPASGNLFAGGYEFLFRSTDNGETWTRIARYPKSLIHDIQVLGNTMYAWMEPLGCLRVHPTGRSSVVRSTDGGTTWNLAYESTATSARKLAIDPHDVNTIYVTTKLAIGKSTNGGTSFTTITGSVQTGEDSPIVVHPTNSSILFYGGADGVYKSTNGGSSWSLTNSGIEWYPYAVTAIAIDPVDPAHVLAGSAIGLYESFDTGATWNVVFPFDLESVDPDPALNHDELWPTSIVFDPSSSQIIHVATRKYGVVSTTDGGITWNPDNSGLFDPRLRRMIAGTGGRFHVATAGSGVFNKDTVAPVAAPELTATANGASVTVAWTSVGAPSYQVERSPDNVSFTPIGTTSALTLNDSGIAANTAYFYRVRAGSGPASNVDFAVTAAFTDEPLVAGATPVRARHVTEIRTGINALRNALGLTAATWGSVATGNVIRAVDLTELRQWMSDTLTALGRTTSFTDASPAGMPIKAVHFQELRNALK